MDAQNPALMVISMNVALVVFDVNMMRVAGMIHLVCSESGVSSVWHTISLLNPYVTSVFETGAEWITRCEVLRFWCLLCVAYMFLNTSLCLLCVLLQVQR